MMTCNKCYGIASMTVKGMLCIFECKPCGVVLKVTKLGAR